MIKLKVQDGVDTPRYQTKLASGFDLQAISIHSVYKGAAPIPPDRLKDVQKNFIDKGFINMRPAERITFKTGVVLADIDSDFEIEIRSRSGMATKKGIFVSNQPGTIDADYRGELLVSLYNSTTFLNAVVKDSRIAQAVVKKIERPKLVITEEVKETDRGEDGFGSTGE